WCVEFASWVARQAGVPLGDLGQGFTNVDQVRDWGHETNRWLPGSSTPQPGDLILFGSRHIGIVDSVNTDGSLETIEGNSSDKVSRVHRAVGEWTDFVRPGSSVGEPLVPPRAPSFPASEIVQPVAEPARSVLPVLPLDS